MKIDANAMYANMRPLKLFFVVALPGMVSMFAMSIYNVLEGVFIGQKLGEAAFAAVNIAFPVIMINFSVADLIGVGASVPISISLGRRDGDAANNIFSCAVALILLASLVMGAAMCFAAEPLARFMGASEEILGASVRYIRTYALMSPVTTIFFAMDNFLRISGYVRMSMLLNIFFNLATLALLLLFLFALGMDVSGSALASCIAMCLCSLMALIPFVRGHALLRFVRPRFRGALLRQIACCGAPVFLSNIAGRVTSVLMNLSLTTLGARELGASGDVTAVAAYGVLMYASEICQPLLYGMSDSLSPAVGFNWGAERYDRVKKLALCNYAGAAAVSLASAAAMFFLAQPLAAMFVKAENASLLRLSEQALRLFSLTYLLRWFTITTQSFLAAIEKPVQATALSIAVALVFPAAMLACLRPLGLNGVWLNMFATSLLALILGAALLKQVFRRRRAASE